MSEHVISATFSECGFHWCRCVCGYESQKYSDLGEARGRGDDHVRVMRGGVQMRRLFDATALRMVDRVLLESSASVPQRGNADLRALMSQDRRDRVQLFAIVLLAVAMVGAFIYFEHYATTPAALVRR